MRNHIWVARPTIWIIIVLTIFIYRDVSAEPYGYIVDNFEYDPADDSPTNNGWQIVSGSGDLLTLEREDILYESAHFMRSISTSGLSFRARNPESGSLESHYKQFSLSVKSPEGYLIELRIVVSISGSGQQEKILRYWPENGTNSKVGDTLNFYLGTGLKNGNWHLLSRNLFGDVRELEGTATFSELTRIELCGSYDIDDILQWERFSVEGYSDKISYTQGEMAYFSLSIDEDAPNPSNFSYGISRYGGTTVQYASGSGSVDYETYNSNEPLGNNWDTTFSVSIGRDWPSGFYAARVALGSGEYSFIPFVVKEDTAGVSSKILFQLTSTTWQAYNYFGGGAFYQGTALDSLSYNRPFSNLHYFPGHQCESFSIPPWSPINGVADSIGAGLFFWWEYPLAHWLETNGYVVEYSDNVDIDYWFDNPLGNHLLDYQMFISCGHDEYWSEEMRRNTEFRFRNSGTEVLPRNLAFFSANTAFRKIELYSERRTMRNPIGGVNFWHRDSIYGEDNPGPEEMLMGSRTVNNGSGYNVCADSALKMKYNPDTLQAPMGDPKQWIVEDLDWAVPTQGDNLRFGRGKYFADRRALQNNSCTFCLQTAEYLSIAGYEVQARDNVQNQGNFPFRKPTELDSIGDIKVLAQFDPSLPNHNASQMTYYQVPPDQMMQSGMKYFHRAGFNGVGGCSTMTRIREEKRPKSRATSSTSWRVSEFPGQSHRIPFGAPTLM